MRKWDLARAAKREKVGFWADNGGYFFIFGIGGGARADHFRLWDRRGIRVVAWGSEPGVFSFAWFFWFVDMAHNLSWR